MTVVVLDVGNSSIKLGLYRKGQLETISRLPSLPSDLDTVRTSLAQTFANLQPIDAVIFCSVVPELSPIVEATALEFCVSHSSQRQTVFNVEPSQLPMPISLGRYPADQIGPDRVVNAYAAHAAYPKHHVIVVDFGTATTFDIVSNTGEFLGGAITPGIGIFSDALFRNTSRLFRVPLKPPASPIGVNSTECLQSGLVYGYRGLYLEILNKLKADLPEGPSLVVATGGAAETLDNMFRLDESHPPLWDIIDPQLTLNGLYGLYRYQLKQQRPMSLVVNAE